MHRVRKILIKKLQGEGNSRMSKNNVNNNNNNNNNNSNLVLLIRLNKIKL
jgi:hypothetical protein